VRTVRTERELDALPTGAKLRFTVSGALITKVTGGLFTVEGHKGVYLPSDLTTNGTPMEVLE
jgi:hypothetical protein